MGNGSIQVGRIHKAGLPVLGRSYPKSDPICRPTPPSTPNPFEIFTYPDVVTLLVFNALVYAVFYGVLTPLSYVFQRRYPYLSQTSIGLCFLAIGGGMVIGTAVTGKILDYQYRRMKNRTTERSNKDNEAAEPANIPPEQDFPIEWARLQSAPVYLLIFTIVVVGYGWALRREVTIAVPLILHIISKHLTFASAPVTSLTKYAAVGFIVAGLMNTVQTLIVDLLPNRGSSVTAAVSDRSLRFPLRIINVRTRQNNLVRCSFGAAVCALEVSIARIQLNTIANCR